jgi:hypothetical protein
MAQRGLAAASLSALARGIEAMDTATAVFTAIAAGTAMDEAGTDTDAPVTVTVAAIAEPARLEADSPVAATMVMQLAAASAAVVVVADSTAVAADMAVVDIGKASISS